MSQLDMDIGRRILYLLGNSIHEDTVPGRNIRFRSTIHLGIVGKHRRFSVQVRNYACHLDMGTAMLALYLRDKSIQVDRLVLSAECFPSHNNIPQDTAHTHDQRSKRSGIMQKSQSTQ